MDAVAHESRGRRQFRLGLRVLVALFVIHAVYRIATGTWLVWDENRDWDLQVRFREYSFFSAGWYPHARFENPPKGVPGVYSVYPPYAFPMLSVFFEPGGLVQGRIVVWTLSIASLAFLGIHARRVLSPFGPEIAALGCATAFTISGNKAAILLGQFSILCTALIFLQMTLLVRGRAVAAGLCWAMAMLKPHVALPFAALFLLDRGWLRGLAAGGTLLLALSWLACACTGVGLMQLVDFWLNRMPFTFASKGLRLGPGPLAAWLGVDPRLVVVIVYGAVLAVAIGLVLFLRRLGPAAMLPFASLLSVVGMLGIYHWMYDQIMLFPAVLATMVVAASTRRPWAIVIAAAMIASLLPPMRWVEKRFLPEAILAVTWIVAGLYPMACLIADARRAKAVPA